nr:dTDP-4-dehydrorhamnose 3,5-epimerase [Acuticoccus kalidii]
MPDVLLITPRRFHDGRGWFEETWSQRRMDDAGLRLEFVQDNQSLSGPAGTVRGLHFQAPPYAQAKLVRCVAGAILDVAVDIRRNSPTYGRWVSAELTAENGAQLLVPHGFAHGFVTLKPDTSVCYKVDGYYDKDSEGGIRFDDPDVAIDWGIANEDAILSDKDRILPPFSELASVF